MSILVCTQTCWMISYNTFHLFVPSVTQGWEVLVLTLGAAASPWSSHETISQCGRQYNDPAHLRVGWFWVGNSFRKHKETVREKISYPCMTIRKILCRKCHEILFPPHFLPMVQSFYHPFPGAPPSLSTLLIIITAFWYPMPWSRYSCSHLKDGKMTFRKVKQFAPGHIASKWQTWKFQTSLFCLHSLCFEPA